MHDHDDAMDVARELDLRGLKCPLPVLRTRRALMGMSPGRLLVVRSTDPLAGLDIPNLVRETGDDLLETGRDGTGARFVIRKRRRCRPAEDATAGSIGESPR